MPNAKRSGAQQRAKAKARHAAGASSAASASGNFTPSGDFSFTSPSSASASFTNPYDSHSSGNGNGNGNGRRAGDSNSDDDSGSNDDSSDEDDSRPPVKADSDLTDAERLARAAEKKELGNVYYKRADYATAVRHYSHAIDLDPSEPSYHLNRAAARMLLKLFGAALEDCLAAQALQKNDLQSKTLLRTAKCQLALGLVAPAQQSLHEAFRLEPGNRAVATEKARAERVAQHVSNIRRDLERKEWSMVLLGVDAAARECEADATPREWRIWKVEALVGKKRYDEAASLAADLLRLDPKQPEPLYYRGLCLYLSGSNDQAIKHCQEALRNDPDYSRARTLLKRIRLVEQLKEQGNTAFKEQRTDEAIQKYSDAMDADPDNETIKAVLLSNRAAAYLRAKNYASAITDCTTCVTLSPSHFKAFRTRARAHLAQEDFEAAVRDFKQAFELAPQGSADEQALKREVREAEAALKKSKMKDHYKILGVETDASEIQIKKAYRMMSLRHHPDKGGDEAVFKEIKASYELLSDPQRRAKFDQGIDEDDPTGGMSGYDDFGGMGGMGGGFGGGAFNMEDLFGGGMGGGGFGGGGGFHSHGGGRRAGGGYSSYGF
ncbi:hypothetical protein JCM8208_000319 [Rhodotorula glutinis]